MKAFVTEMEILALFNSVKDVHQRITRYNFELFMY